MTSVLDGFVKAGEKLYLHILFTFCSMAKFSTAKGYNVLPFTFQRVQKSLSLSEYLLRAFIAGKESEGSMERK